MITVRDVLNHLQLDNITDVNVLIDNGLSFTDIPRWMYRAEHDVVMYAVTNSLQFQYPPDDRPGVLGLGGIYFGCNVQHVLGYAKDKTQANAKHFFMCPMPEPVVVWQHQYEWQRGPIVCDTLARDVRSGDHVGDEFVKAGHHGDAFSPNALIFVRVRQ